MPVKASVYLLKGLSLCIADGTFQILLGCFSHLECFSVVAQGML